MTNPQDRISKIAQQGQEAVSGAVRTWSDSLQRLSGQAGGSATDVSALVDNAFDLAERLLETQRQFTKNVLEAVASRAAGAGDSAQQGADAADDAAGNAAAAADAKDTKQTK
jgi:hypothetical protein